MSSLLCVLLACLIAFFACSKQDADAADGAPSDTDTDADTDTDTDSDSDSDSETSTETEEEECVHPEVVADCQNGWCKIPPGCYTFGSPPTEPCRAAYAEAQVKVTLTRPFIIAQTELTQEKWEAAGFPNPSPTPHCADCPVSMIDWYEALAYCNVLSANEGLEPCYDLSCCEGVVGEGCAEGMEMCIDGNYNCDCEVHRFSSPYECPGYRLPTTAEWQYAVRAGTTEATYIGNLVVTAKSCEPEPIADQIAWSCSNASHAMAVSLKTPNGWGLYDMLGNLEEWCSDYWNNTAFGGGADHVTDPHDFDVFMSRRSVKGSVWLADTCTIRSAKEGGHPPYFRINFVGFRPARTIFE